MKTQKTSTYLMVVAIIGLIFTGCKKEETTNPVVVADDSNLQYQSASDQLSVENESNKSLDEANSVMDGLSTLRSGGTPCNVTVDSSAKSIGLIKLTFTGNNCDNTRSRSGTIDIQLPYNSATQQVTKWDAPGTVVMFTYTNFKVTNLSDNKSVTLNGTHVVTNVSGGRVRDITEVTPRIHKIRGDMTLTFDDGTVRTWSVARVRKFDLTGGVLSTQLSGDTTINSNTNVAMWGTNREGESFVVSIATPVVVNISGSSCIYKPISGVRVLHGSKRELIITYGVDASGNVVADDTCPYGYKLNWTNKKGEAKEAIKMY